MSKFESEWKSKLNIVFKNDYFWKIIAIFFALVLHYDLQKTNNNIDNVNRSIWSVESKINQLHTWVELVKHAVDDVGKEISDLNG